MLGLHGLSGRRLSQQASPYQQLFSLRILPKEFKIPHVIKNIEFLLVFAGAEEILAQTGSATEHLPEL